MYIRQGCATDYLFTNHYSDDMIILMNIEKTQSKKELERLQKESEEQALPESKAIVTLSPKIRKRLNNLPDPKNPPLGYDEHKAFDRVFPYLNIPSLHPKTNDDTVIFNDPDSDPNKLYLGDNLEVLRTLKSESIDLIYIDPPFFSGRNYNVIWGDTNEVRTFEDIWEGGITSYLIWLNARLWEMKRVLKKNGSIYVHCDWHASHYIKTEMDKIFGYDNFRNEIIWKRTSHPKGSQHEPKKLGIAVDTIFWYSKTDNYTFNLKEIKRQLSEEEIDKKYPKTDTRGRYCIGPIVCSKSMGPRPNLCYEYKGYFPPYESGWRLSKEKLIELDESGNLGWTKNKTPLRKLRPENDGGEPLYNIFDDIDRVGSGEMIGYPTQKPEALLERIIKASSNKGDAIADFFVGGGTTCAVAQKLKRKFIGCDSSRVAVSVTLDRLVKIGEEMSGVKSNISYKSGENFQLGLQAKGLTEKVPNIEVSYLGVYPTEKFRNLNQEDFNKFVLTSYGGSANTIESKITGYRPPAHQEPILIGPSDPKQSIDAKEIKIFYDEIKKQLEVNQLVRAKIIGWRFSREVIKYIKVLNQYSSKYNLPLEIEAIPLDSKEFRNRILQRMPDLDESELFLRFSKSPAIGGIIAKKISSLEFEFKAMDAISINEDGWLVNCQWDFDYQEGHFSSDKEYILSREKKKDKKRGEIFEAILSARHKFEKEGEYTIACKVQDNLAGENIFTMKLKVN